MIPKDIHAWYDMEVWRAHDLRITAYLDISEVESFYKPAPALLNHEMGHYIEVPDAFVLDPLWGFESRGLLEKNVDREIEVMWIQNMVELHCNYRPEPKIEDVVRSALSPAYRYYTEEDRMKEQKSYVKVSGLLKTYSLQRTHGEFLMQNLYRLNPLIQKWDIQKLWAECQRKNALVKSLKEGK